MSEHLADAADLAEDRAATEPRLLPVTEALKRHADELRAGIR